MRAGRHKLVTNCQLSKLAETAPKNTIRRMVRLNVERTKVVQSEFGIGFRSLARSGGKNEDEEQQGVRLCPGSKSN